MNTKRTILQIYIKYFHLEPGSSFIQLQIISLEFHILYIVYAVSCPVNSCVTLLTVFTDYQHYAVLCLK